MLSTPPSRSKEGNRSILIKTIKLFTVLSTVSTPLWITRPPSAYATMQRFETNVNRKQCPPKDPDDDKDVDSGEGKEHSEIPNVETIHQVYKFLHEEYGFSGETVAGILGNFWQESQLNPWTVERLYTLTPEESAKAGLNTHTEVTGIGLAQWTGGRNKLLMDYIQEETGDKLDWIKPELQMKFMVEGDSPMFIDILQRIALEDKGVMETLVDFHDDWERSADTKEFVIRERGRYAKIVWEYMQENNMTGKKDDEKIKKLGRNLSDGDGPTSTATNQGNETVDICDSNNYGTIDGEMGASVEANGKKITQRIPGKNGADLFTEEDARKEDWWDVVSLPTFPERYDFSVTPFGARALRGQCTEMTWIYFEMLYNDGHYNGPAGNGAYVYNPHFGEGADTTMDPTVGYAFSLVYDFRIAQSGWDQYGHTGIVVGVLDDGSFITIEFNLPPYRNQTSLERTPIYVHRAGNEKTNSNGIFFSGLGGAKEEFVKNKKVDRKQRDVRSDYKAHKWSSR